MPEIAGTFSRVIGRRVDYVQVLWGGFEEQMGEEYTVMYRWFNDDGYEADIPVLKQEHPGLLSFEQYLRGHGWENVGSSSEGRDDEECQDATAEQSVSPRSTGVVRGCTMGA